MSGHHEKPPQTKASKYITLGIIILTILMFILAFHPFGTIIDSDFPEDEVIVAVSLPFEGEMTEFGVEYMRGIELAVEDINDEGGIRGVPVRAVYFDNKGNVTLAKAQFKEIRDLGIPVVIGGVSSTVTLAMAPYAESYEIVLISPSATSASLSAYGNYVYRTVSSDIYLGAGMAKIIGGRNETQNVMLISLDTSYGKSLRYAFLKEANASYPDMHIVSDISVPDSDTVNITEIITAMKDTHPQSVLLIVNPSQGVEIMKAAEKEGLSPAWFASDTLTNRQVPLEVGAYADGLIGFSQARRISDPSYEEHYIETFGEELMVRDSIYGYETMIVVSQAIENSGYTADGIREGLDLIRHVGLTGTIVFDEKGDAYPSYDVMRLENGEWVDLPWKEVLTFEKKAAAISSAHSTSSH
ncbi:MAG: branched-chain amino acid ABC transporter substrate-binding protein [Methanocorpusculum sp.]|uniref:ABC transporter substrate-binding protein n=1 Tax=Methanocorpusculum sp. TaxID=2058474 RepID=UPI00271B47E4|nr:branched-chain amino acid ABC transporter substrate-binding protein [Methanocorpusculum sp.]MDO9522726.1 branched-chain amino acid ABC transporter substrate-binding protein [Methanocorpusculum sp.]